MSANAPVTVEQEVSQGFETDVEKLLVAQNGERHRNGFARFQRIVTLCAAAADLVFILLGLFLANSLYQRLHLGKQLHYPTDILALWALGFGALFVGLLGSRGGYRPWNSMLQVRETEIVLRVSLSTFVLLLTISLFSNYLVSRWLLFLAFLIVPMLLLVERQIVYGCIRALHSRGIGVQRVLLYGAGSTGRRIFSTLARSPRLGLDPVLFVDDEPSRAGATIAEASYARRRSIQVVAGPPTEELLRRHGITQLVITIPSITREKFLAAALAAGKAGVEFSFVPQHFAPSDHWVDYEAIDGVLLASYRVPESSRGYKLIKRVFDFLVSLGILIVISPFFLLTILLIRMTTPGPGLFVQKRVGKNGTEFDMYKFRTMYSAASAYEYSPQTDSDRRITRIGRYLRRTSLDELPQLLNVVKGDMSLVGPRPEMPFIVAQYNQLHRERLRVIPGITGLWQLSGDRAYLIHENMEYDLYYIRNRNFFMDLAILLHTFFFAARGV